MQLAFVTILVFITSSEVCQKQRFHDFMDQFDSDEASTNINSSKCTPRDASEYIKRHAKSLFCCSTRSKRTYRKRSVIWKTLDCSKQIAEIFRSDYISFILYVFFKCIRYFWDTLYVSNLYLVVATKSVFLLMSVRTRFTYFQ